MTAPEWEALWELAANRRGRLGCRFVEEAARGPVTTRQLRDRAALALHAAVGLDAARRDEVEALLLARLEEPALGDEQKTDLARALSAWDGLSGSAAARTARQFTRALKDTKDRFALEPLARGLSAVAARLEAQEAAVATAPAAATLLQALKDNKNTSALQSLAQGLSAVADRLEAKDAAQAAATFAQAMKDTKDPYTLSALAGALSAVAARLEAKDAARSTGQAAATLAQAMKDTKYPGGLHLLAEGLSAVAGRLEPQYAAQVAATLVQALKDTKDPNALYELAEGLSAVEAHMEARAAASAMAQAAAILVENMKDAIHPDFLRKLSQGLSALLSAGPPAEIPLRSATAASAVIFPAGTAQPLAALAPLISAAERPPCRLSTQHLVELLKMPTCIGEARRVVLDQLGNRYRRAFADVWEFVRFAREENLDLDFTTPPQRPEPAATTAKP
jgi:hypothetical protein